MWSLLLLSSLAQVPVFLQITGNKPHHLPLSAQQLRDKMPFTTLWIDWNSSAAVFSPPRTGEGEGTKHASGLDSPGGISINMGQPSATCDIYCTPRCRTKHCILLTMPRLCRHLPARSLSPALPCSWQPGLTKTWKSPNDIIWSFKEKKSGEEPIKKFVFTLVLAAALGNVSSCIPKLCSAVLERRKQNTRPMRSD